MLIFKRGNLFDETNADALVNTVNCVGIMGRGVALQFKRMYPDNFKAYNKACKAGEVQPGKMFVYATNTLTSPHFIINFPTKRHWRFASKLEDIRDGLYNLVTVLQTRKIKKVVLPPLGCGLGGLNWNEVKSLIQDSLKNLPDIEIVVYEPMGAPIAEKQVKNKNVPKMTNGRAALLLLIARYLQGFMSPYVTLLELHKLMYFLQYSGEKLDLRYKKALYGPYSENLRNVLQVIEGYFIIGYADGGDQPMKPIFLMPGALQEAEQFIQESCCETTKRNIEKVASLVQGFESPYGLELLATVLWVVENERASDVQTIVHAVYNWNAHKKQFSQFEIEKAIEALSKQGWIKVA